MPVTLVVNEQVKSISWQLSSSGEHSDLRSEMAVRWRSNTVPSDDVDPLTLALQPPANETPEERVVRLREEAKAKAISDKIDDQIRIEREEVVKRKKNGVVKILLLGDPASLSAQSFCSARTAKPYFNLQANPNPASPPRLKISRYCIRPMPGGRNAYLGEV